MSTYTVDDAIDAAYAIKAINVILAVYDVTIENKNINVIKQVQELLLKVEYIMPEVVEHMQTIVCYLKENLEKNLEEILEEILKEIQCLIKTHEKDNTKLDELKNTVILIGNCTNTLSYSSFSQIYQIAQKEINNIEKFIKANDKERGGNGM